MSLRARAKSAIKEGPSSSSSSSSQSHSPPPPPPSSSSSSSSSSALSQALAGTASLAKLLPTGTLLAFQLLTPVFTNHGSCDPAARLLTLALLLLLALSCFLASFTDSIRIPSHGRVYYGLATPRGLLLFDYPPAPDDAPDTSRYRLRPVDFVHAALSVLVFGAVALRDANVLGCFYPSPQGPQAREVLDALPLGVGLLCSLLFVVFPTTRHGIGYPLSIAAAPSSN
ncbi:hypothetical protein ACMD2_10831 [Ananas comosus]|uniref:Protein DMP3-like n=1 Tax=Ananas comosus TaxID=4615 RepID=A0A199VWI0_ANACO|nr:hypothetical protein ACMD2_10831 [Ananas comosus]